MSNRLRFLALLGCALIVGTAAAPAAAATIAGDPRHSSAQFSVKHLSISTVVGTIPVVSWSGACGADLVPTEINATLDATGIDTKNADRDRDLRGPAWLNTDKYPTLTFKSTKIQAGPDGTFKAAGQLTINGITKSVTFDGKVDGSIPDPAGGAGKRVAYTATATIDRRDFGLNFDKSAPGGYLIASYDVGLTIQAEGLTKP
jgi:polyisoprenoid-binding protein YceI